MRVAHKDGFRTSKILDYGSYNLNFLLEMVAFDLERKMLPSLVNGTVDFYRFRSDR